MTVSYGEVAALYDPLMENINAKLVIEFEKNRLKGADYAAVYAKALESTLAEVVKLLLGRDDDLIAAQIEATLAGADKTKQEITNLSLEANNIPKEGLILDAKLPNTIKEGLILDQQKLNLIAERGSINASTDKLVAELTLVPKEGNKLDAETANINGKTGLIPKESELMDAKIVNLLRENDKLELEKDILTIQKDNLTIEGDNAEKVGKNLDQDLLIKKEEVKASKGKVKLTCAETWLKRAQAYQTDKVTALKQCQAETGVLSVMVGAYSSAMNHDPDLTTPFNQYSLVSLAGQAAASAKNMVDTSIQCNE
jgi:hypothetical protein